MANNSSIGIECFLSERESIPVVDVRSPSEFEKGHILNSINIPLFNDEERVIVGTTYKNKGRNFAVQSALDLVGPNMSSKVREAMKISTNGKLLVYCWRGGMRSASMAWLFNQVGIETRTLIGGYKSYRRLAQKYFEKPHHIFILGGMTGSGKTALLKQFLLLGQQVIDLEGIANHKGSAFGGIGQKAQPPTEQFENFLFEELYRLNPTEKIWIEDESISIGSVFIPNAFFKQMRNAPIIAIERTFSDRVTRLEEEYATLSSSLLIGSVNRISKKLGGDNTKICIDSIESGNFRQAIEICLRYYDKTYTYGLENHEKKPFLITLKRFNVVENAADILKYAEEIPNE